MKCVYSCKRDLHWAPRDSYDKFLNMGRHTHTWLTLIRTLPISIPTEVNKGNPRQSILLTNELPGKPRTIAYHLHTKSVKTNVDSVPKGTDEEIF